MLVLGTERSLRKDMMTEAKSVQYVWGPRRDAYKDIDKIEEEVGTFNGPILLCLGAAATVLAARLADKGLYALDLGHIGMMMRHSGSYNVGSSELISAEYAAILRSMHRKQKWGLSSHTYAKTISDYAKKLGVADLIDYGSGGGTLKPALHRLAPDIKVWEYDPGIAGKEQIPPVAHLVVCTDVLEHVEPDKLDAVIKHLYALCALGAFILIATRPANMKLPDGRNAHLIIEHPDWWEAQLMKQPWTLVDKQVAPAHAVKFWLKK